MNTAPDDDLAGKRILIAEDDFFVADQLARDLAGRGAVVIGPLSSLAAAIEAAERETRLDGAILDVNLLGERIYPLVDRLRARGVPCVFATGYDRYTIPSLYQHIPHGQKPFDSRTVITALFG